MIRREAVLALALGVLAQPATAQYTVGTGVDYMGYSFDAGLGADAAQLLMIPIAVRMQLTDALTFDVFSAWAEGRVERDNTQLTLSGPIDTNVKLSYQATPWAFITIGANVPSGNATHTAEEAVVASVSEATSAPDGS